MMKTKKTFAILGIIAAAGLFLGALGIAFGASPFIYFDGRKLHAEKNRTETENIERLSEEAFTDIDINLPSADVTIEEGDDYGFRIENNSGREFVCSNENGHLRIKQRFIWFQIDLRSLFTGSERDRLTVYYPKGAEFRNVSLSLASGSAEVFGMKGKDLKLDAASGNFKINDAVFDSIDFDLASGDAEFFRVSADSLKMNAVSGRCHFDEMKIGNADLSLVSGNLTAAAIETNGLKLDVISGDVSMDGVFRGTSILDAVSGDITINVTGLTRDSHSVDFNSISGSLHMLGVKVEKSYKSFSNGTDNVFKIDTVSGSVVIDAN